MALRSESQMVQLYAAGAMGNLANHTASLAVVTAARGLVRSVVRLTRQGKSPQVVETAAGAVRNLAACQRCGHHHSAAEPLPDPKIALWDSCLCFSVYILFQDDLVLAWRDVIGCIH